MSNNTHRSHQKRSKKNKLKKIENYKRGEKYQHTYNSNVLKKRNMWRKGNI